MQYFYHKAHRFENKEGSLGIACGKVYLWGCFACSARKTPPHLQSFTEIHPIREKEKNLLLSVSSG